MTKARILALVILGLTSPLSFGADCALAGKDEVLYDVLHRHADDGCLGREKDSDAATKAFRRSLSSLAEEDDPPAVMRERWLVMAAQTIEGLEADLAQVAAKAGNPAKTDLDALGAKLKAVRQQMIGAGDYAAFSKLSFSGNKSDDWAFEFAQAQFIQLGIPKITTWLPDSCVGPVTPACALPYESASEMLRVSGVMSTLMYFPDYLIANQQKLDLHRRNTEWKNYFEKARAQYWWELKFNSLIYDLKNQRKQVCGDGNDKVAASCARIGAFEPPHDQFIVLHPTAALEYIDGAKDGEQFKPAAVMEWLGYNHWSWKKDGAMGLALGASVISTYADRDGTKDLRHGFVLHVNHRYSAGMSFGDGKTGFFVSADLGKAIVDAKDEAHKALRFGD